MKNKIKNIFIIILIIIIGLISRKIEVIPNVFGDFLYAIMIFYIIKLFLNLKIKYIILISLITSFSIEFSQLINIEFLNNLRENAVWKLILGQTFSFPDLIAYSLGIAAVGIYEIKKAETN